MSSIKIKIEIAGRQYPLNVKPEEEVLLRQAGKEINQSIREFTKQFAVDNTQDVLAMLCLQLQGKLLSWQEENKKQNQQIQKKLEQFSKLMDVSTI